MHGSTTLRGRVLLSGLVLTFLAAPAAAQAPATKPKPAAAAPKVATGP
ncbi:MAG: hypothetical protein H6R40_1112, partial [Gemmatimonadetes bacterium]|nr:hypothetical protein [Gemmatimonadota bacterium]